MRIHDLALGSRIAAVRASQRPAAAAPARRRPSLPLWLHGVGLALLLAGAVMLLAAAGGLAMAAAWLGGVLALAGAAVAFWSWRRALARDAQTGDALLLAAIDVPATALAITGRQGALIAANSGYRRLLGGYPSPLDLDERGEAAREARICGSGTAALTRGGQALALTARRFQHLPDYLIWQVTALGDGGAPAALADQYRLYFGPWLDRLGIGMVLSDAHARFLAANETVRVWAGTLPDAGAPLDALLGEDADSGAVVVRGVDGGVTVAAADAALPADAGRVLLLRRRQDAVETPAPVLPRAGERLPQQVFTQAPMGMALVDARGDVLRANKVLRTLADIEDARDDFNVLDTLVAADRPRAAALLAQAASKGARPDPLDVHFTAAADTVCQLIARPVGGDGGDGGDIVLFVKDTTEQKRLELQFAQAQKMQAIGQLAGGIAHDFNNILTAIIGFCDLLLVRHAAGDASFSDIQQIKQNANRAADLVRQLLAFSRKQTLRPSVIDITDVLAELSNLLRRLIGENIELKMVHGRNLGAVKVDQSQFEQVIINLAVNARDAMPGGGTLAITTSRLEARDVRGLGHDVMPQGDYVAIEVRDTGQGIPAENLQKIFEPFFTTKEVGKGTGLGLSTVYGIVKQTGGFIFAHSQPGEGAAFTIYLPVHRETPGAGASAAAGKADRVADLWGRGTILLVEDEDPVRTFAHRALTKKGYTVLEAASGERALQLVRDHEGPIDLVVSDVVMPNMDGPALVQEIRKLIPNIKVIFISGYAQDDFRNSIAEGAYSFLPKPFSLNQLAETVKDVLSAVD
ncbi:MAG: response regulator [Alphaproteobacteria bacterium]|nr:MAG: response regulator [Alphaproteobacteria bacterium]